jgi:PST family polysaccharide transporter
MVGVALGVPYGPKGVAVAYSTVMTAKIVPIAAWALHGTGIRVMELLQALGRPMGASIVAAVISYAVQVLYGWTLPLLPRLALEMASFGAVYLYVLLFVAGQRSVYLDLIRAAKPSPSC